VHHLHKLLDHGSVRCHLPAASRKRALQLIAELLADEHLAADTLFDTLMGRERLGSTALGEGVAIPHCRVETDEMRVALVSLPEGVDFEAADGEPVDLLFVLVVPENEKTAHLEALAALAAVFGRADNRSELRACATDTRLHDAFCAQLDAQAPGAKRA